MRLINRLKSFEQKYVFLRWATGAEYGKIMYVGEDYIEFNIVDVDTMEYRETVVINSQLILEIIFADRKLIYELMNSFDNNGYNVLYTQFFKIK